MAHKTIHAFTLALLAGCTSVGPVDQPQFMPMVEKASGVPASNISISGRAMWVQTNTDFCWYANPGLNILLQTSFLKCTEDQIQNTNRISNFPTEKAPPRKEGVIVVSDTALTFLDWNEAGKDYSKSGALGIGNINTLEMHSFGQSRLIRLTVANSEYKYYTLRIVGAQGQQQDRAKNDMLFDHIKSRLGKDGKVFTY